MQRQELDFDDTFAFVAKTTSVRTLFVLAAVEDFEIDQMDVKTAFVHGPLKEKVYVEQPTGYVQGFGLVCRLNKTLYGLKQSPRAWYKTLASFLTALNYGLRPIFKDIDADHAVFINTQVTIIVYVNDLLLLGLDMNDNQELKKEFHKRFEMTDLKPCKQFLGIQITQDRSIKTIRLSQSDYLKKVLQEHGMEDSKPLATPMKEGLVLPALDKKTPVDPDLAQQYQSAIRSLMYAMVYMRPDLAYAVSKLSQYGSNPKEVHWKAVKRVLRYIKGTLDYSLTFGGTSSTTSLVGYTDSDLAGNKESRRSTNGYVFFLGNVSISWKSKLQLTVALSSCETEYIAATQATKETVWI